MFTFPNRECLTDIISLWQKLVDQSDRKGKILFWDDFIADINKRLILMIESGAKLKEANDQQQFNRNVEDVDLWLGEIEGQLSSEDYGKVFFECSS